MSREDIEVVRAIYARWQRGDSAAELFDPEIEWSTPHPDAAGIRGRDEVVAFLRRYAGTFEDYTMELEDVRDLGGHRVEVRFSESGRGKGSGAETNLRARGVWTVRDGRAISYRPIPTERPRAGPVAGWRGFGEAGTSMRRIALAAGGGPAGCGRRQRGI